MQVASKLKRYNQRTSDLIKLRNVNPIAGRRRQFDEAASAEITMQLFWTQGYEAASLND